MNRWISLAALSGMLLSTTCLIESVHADGCRQRTSARIAKSQSIVTTAGGLVVVPFAVPVAVPVATIAQPTILYGYSAAARDNARVNGDVHGSGADDSIVPDAAAATHGEAAADTIIRRRCTSCHSAADAKGGLILEGISLDKLKRPQRVEMLRRMTTTDPALRMPKEGPLARDEIDVLVEALVK